VGVLKGGEVIDANEPPQLMEKKKRKWHLLVWIAS